MSAEEDLKAKLLSSFKLDSGEEIKYYSLTKLEDEGFGRVGYLPFSIRVVLESLIRNLDGKEVTIEDVKSLAGWDCKNPADREIPFKVSRILMQDFTGVPAVVDLAAMRDYITSVGGSAEQIQPTIPVDLIIDHSVQVDAFNAMQALEINQEMEIKRNKERYKLLKWASKSFSNFRVLPPSAGICHQVNLEYIATCVSILKTPQGKLAMPDTLVGTDSHTTMINGLGVVGFGVGGIEAEAALLSQAVGLTTPKVLGVHITGRLAEGITATDFALTLTKRLREIGVVNMFVEFYGEGIRNLTLPERATLSNMCPEYGATIAIFPVDQETINYLELTARPKEQIELVKKYYKAQQMLDADYNRVRYSDTMEVDLGKITACVSGPSQPKQEIPLEGIRENFNNTFLQTTGEGPRVSSSDSARWSDESSSAAAAATAPAVAKGSSVHLSYPDGYETDLKDGDVVISSITSCTNTSNPSVMIGAGILAKKALAKGLRVDTRKVKTSLGPGSRVVMRYLEKAGLAEPLQKLGYGLVGYGCITCIGNSGPLIDKQSDAINANNIVVASVLSGNRNYEARIHRDVRANYLMSPPLLIAFAIAGTVLKDLTKDPLGFSRDGVAVYLKDIWPTGNEIYEAMKDAVNRDLFMEEYAKSLDNVNPYWNSLPTATGLKYEWEKDSTYIRMPPFFHGFDPKSTRALSPISGAAILAVFADSISTDHISPAGAIGKDSPAGKYLEEHGIAPADFNSYGSRRGNHEVMMRGTFANNRIKNIMMGGKEGGLTIHYPDQAQMAIYDAAMKYREEKVPLVVIAGAEYGSGSSRDWAAKGPMLLGVKAVVAKSFERIHRSNLVGMGVVPLQFKQGEDAQALKIDPSKPVSIMLSDQTKPKSTAKMQFIRLDASAGEADLTVRIDNEVEMDYYRSGGILNYVIKKISSGR